MKRVIYGMAFIVAITAGFAFKSGTAPSHNLTLSTQNVYNRLDNCDPPKVCSNIPNLACLVDASSNPVTMYDDQHICVVVSQFQFRP